MAYQERLRTIQEIERLRGSKVICYLTSIRPNLMANMAEDAVRVFFDHLLRMPRPQQKLDIFLCSNGGQGTVPWRLISLFREWTDRVSVLLPFRAYSAAVSNDYNPIEVNTNRRLGISVEDVKAYVSFIKETVGIKHEAELVRTVEILANKVHPLALGNVERFLLQSRMIARKILSLHMKDEASKHRIDEIVETLASKLYFHGHPINRREAKEDLGLSAVSYPSQQLEAAIWRLYLDFEEELQNRVAWDPGALINKNVRETVDPASGQTVRTVAAVDVSLRLAFVESAQISSCFQVDKKIAPAGQGPNGELMLRDETLDQGWRHSEAPAHPQNQPQKSRTRSGVRATRPASRGVAAASGRSELAENASAPAGRSAAARRTKSASSRRALGA